MPDSRRVREIDGFSAVSAVRHARQQPPRPPSSPEPPSESAEADKPKRTARIGRTALPTKYEIFCYECGHAFTVTGKVRTLVCHQCKTLLNQVDVTMATTFNETIKTTGTVMISANAVMEGGLIAACDVILGGRITGGQVRAFRELEIRPTSVFEQAMISAQDLHVAAGATVNLVGSSIYRHVEIDGNLTGDIDASGLVHVGTEGCLQGRVRAAKLQIDEGGGLLADVRVTERPWKADGKNSSSADV